MKISVEVYAQTYHPTRVRRVNNNMQKSTMTEEWIWQLLYLLPTIRRRIYSQSPINIRIEVDTSDDEHPDEGPEDKCAVDERRRRIYSQSHINIRIEVDTRDD